MHFKQHSVQFAVEKVFLRAEDTGCTDSYLYLSIYISYFQSLGTNLTFLGK